jgi:acetolactate synthase-1/2/3 large subunit
VTAITDTASQNIIGIRRHILTLSDLIVEYLERFGVEYVFAVPGSPLGPLFDALARSARRGGPRAVLSRHESGAAFMADGYARGSGRIGVCCTTTGPGATNLITGVASACAEKIPLLAITTQTRLPQFSFGSFQDSTRNGIDIMGMFEHCTRYNSMVTHPEQLERKLAAALTTALGRPKGPAHLSIPVDILAAESAGPACFVNLQTVLSAEQEIFDNSALERLWLEIVKVLDDGGRIVLLAGCNALGGGNEITRFAELTDSKIITTPRGKAAINPYHPLYRGVFGCSGHSSARQALAEENVDLIIAIGTNLSEWATSRWDPILLNGKLVHIHDNSTCFSRSPMARLHLLGDTVSVFKRLNDRLEIERRKVSINFPPNEKVETDSLENRVYIPANINVIDPTACDEGDPDRPVRVPRLFAELIERLPMESRYFIDNSNSVPWSIHYFFHPRPEAYHLSIEFATMAWAIGAAIGSEFADRSSPAVCITGDGCYLMSGQEITVALEDKLPVIFVVINDSAYGLIRHAHRHGGKEKVEFAIPNVDFAMMARATGARAYTIRTARELESVDWKVMADRQGPTLLDIWVDPEDAPPLAMA